jgi:uncharacterized protein YdaU (DUF1376 family)
MKAPAFQFYADDFIGGTVVFSAEDVGAYMRLLCYQWGNGAIPDRKELVDRIAGCVVGPDVMAKFPDGRNARMEREREKQAEYRAQQSAKGKASAQARFNRGSTVVQPSGEPEGQPKVNSPSPSPSPSPISNTFTDSNSEDSPPALSPKAAKVRRKAETETDDAWIAGLEKMDCFRLIPIRDELGLAQAWCAAHPGRTCTRQFFNRWLLRSVQNFRTISTNGNSRFMTADTVTDPDEKF